MQKRTPKAYQGSCSPRNPGKPAARLVLHVLHTHVDSTYLHFATQRRGFSRCLAAAVSKECWGGGSSPGGHREGLSVRRLVSILRPKSKSPQEEESRKMGYG